MFLNCFAQPTLLNPNREFFNINEFKESPILLCHKNALDGKLMPTNWSGHIYATANIINELNHKAFNNINLTNANVLNPNEIYNISIGNDDKQCKVKGIELAAIPWDKENLLFLIKADNVTNLLSDIITNDVEVFTQNKILRNAIKTGIDVLYVNDGIYNKTPQLKNYPTECLLGTLLTLVQPRFVHGLSGKEQLPQYMTNCCKKR